MKRLLIALFVIASLTLFAGASFNDIVDTQLEAVDTKNIERALPDDAVGDIGSPSDGVTLNGGLSSVFTSAWEKAKDILMASLKTGMKVISVGIICSLASLFIKGNQPDITGAVGVFAILLSATTDVRSLFSIAEGTLNSLSTLSKAILPPLAALTTASGHPGVSAAMQFVSVVVSDFIITVMKQYILPLIYVFIGASALASALKSDLLKQLAELIQWGVSRALGFAAGAFTAYLALSGTLAYAGDAMTLKAAKLTLSGGVPVVGGVLSDAAGTVLSAAALIRNSVGLYGMLAVLSVCVLPVLNLVVQHVLFRIFAAFASPCAGDTVSGFVKSLSDAFGLMLGMCATAAFLLIISFASALAANGG